MSVPHKTCTHVKLQSIDYFENIEELNYHTLISVRNIYAK